IAKHIGYLPFPLPTKRDLEFILSRWADLLLAVSIALEPGGLVVLALLLVYYAYLEGQAFGRFRRIPQPLRDILNPHYHPVDLHQVRIAERIDVPQGGAITFDREVFFPVGINPYDPVDPNNRQASDLWWLLHELQSSTSTWAGRCRSSCATSPKSFRP